MIVLELTKVSTPHKFNIPVLKKDTKINLFLFFIATFLQKLKASHQVAEL